MISTVPDDPRTGRQHPVFDVAGVRGDFPILRESHNGKALIYLDNANTSHKPRAVIDATSRYYETSNANVHRSVYWLSVRATDAYEGARAAAQRFVGAARPEEIVFVRGTTEAINLVAHTYGRAHVGAGDEIVVSAMEHHSNIVPWQILCEQTGARLQVVPINDNAELDLNRYEELLGSRTKLVAMLHVSNALGTINPIGKVIDIAHRRGIPVLVDGAQAAPHLAVDVSKLDADFYTLSSHKMYGPTGIGILYGKYDLLQEMPPFQGGGDMIKSVRFEKTEYNDVPYKFEAGTPNIAGAVGFGAAIDYVTSIGLDAIEAYEHDLLTYATQLLKDIPEIRLIGTAGRKASVISFVVEGVHPHDVGTILDQCGIAVRTGHHCAQPVMQRFKVPATTRASLALYNTREEVDALVAGIRRVIEVFS